MRRPSIALLLLLLSPACSAETSGSTPSSDRTPDAGACVGCCPVSHLRDEGTRCRLEHARPRLWYCDGAIAPDAGGTTVAALAVADCVVLDDKPTAPRFVCCPAD